MLIDLLRPARQVLPQYMPQVTKTRGLLINLIGILAAAAAGAIYGNFFAKLPSQYLLVLIAPLAVMALAVIWVLPDRDTAPSRTMTQMLLAFFAVSIAWPDYLALQLPGLPWISFRRLFLAPTVLLLLVCVSVNSQFRRDMRDVLQSEPLVWKLLVAFVLLQLLSILGAPSPAAALKNFINYQLAWTGVFFASVYAFRNIEVTTRFLKIFLMAAITIGFIAILESMNHGVLWRNHVPTFLQVDLETMAGTMETEMRNGLYRAKSIYGQPLPFAEIMALTTPVILYFMFTTKVVWKRVALFGVDMVLFYVLTLPQSRLGVIGFLLSHALFIGVWSGRIWLRNKFSIVGPMITLAYPVAVIALAGAVMSVGSLRAKVMGGGDTVYSDQARKIQKLTARNVILRNPVIGHGPRQAANVLGFVAYGRVTLDNYYLWVALDYGLIGFIVYFA
ncbi:MAG: O-antigen ligase family protein, partial [Sphingomonadaceae bacterium]